MSQRESLIVQGEEMYREETHTNFPELINTHPQIYEAQKVQSRKHKSKSPPEHVVVSARVRHNEVSCSAPL